MNPQELAQLRRLASLPLAGPLARPYAVGGGAKVSSSCAQVLKFWPVEPEHHILQLVVKSTQNHLGACLDGGWLHLQLALSLFLALRDRASPSALHGLALSAQRVDAALSECRLPFELQLQPVLALLRSALCKPVALSDPQDVRHLSAVLLEAFLSTAPGMDEGRTWSEVLRLHWFCGEEVVWSSMRPGLLLDTPASLVPAQAGDLRLVLFEASLEQWLPTEMAGARFEVETSLTTSKDLGSLRSWEMAQFRKLADSLVEAKVQVLACQKLVDPFLRDLLRSKGVSVLWRLSIRHIEFVRRLSGATPVTSLSLAKWQEVLGWVGSVEMLRLVGRDYVAMAPPASHPCPGMASMLVAAPDEPALQELKQCLPQAIHCLWTTVQCGFVFLGGGLTELHVALELEKLAAETESSAAVAVLQVAQCLKDVVSNLAPSRAKAEVLQAAHAALRAALPEGNALVLDAEAPKRRGLLGALNLAALLLRLGEVLDFRTQTLG
ncbi:unnamed protein product [Effrenium voratum]|uniref:Uncharacterized protein n=1 Tax=Effrenium voratum TaxID=2562239 RepID=A0AA36JJE2_9DINO|nr:unnamed protein product [Effrenium voratum]CAJ1416966.1 unnamed protein product [Effrenium voratum]